MIYLGMRTGVRILLGILVLLKPVGVGADSSDLSHSTNEANQSSKSTQSELIFGFGHYPPYQYGDGQKYSGFDLDVVRAVVKKMGYKAKFEMRPWNRAYAKGVSGQYTGLFSMSVTEERSHFFYFSEPISRFKSVFVKRKSDSIEWDEIVDLAPYKIGFSAAYGYTDEFLQAIESGQLPWVFELAGSHPELSQLDRLSRGRTDIFICDLSVCMYLIDKHAPRFSNLDFVSKPLEDDGTFHVGFSKKWPNAVALTKRFNEEFRAVVKSGLRDKILKRYNVVNDLKLTP